MCHKISPFISSDTYCDLHDPPAAPPGGSRTWRGTPGGSGGLPEEAREDGAAAVYDCGPHARFFNGGEDGSLILIPLRFKAFRN